MQEENSQSDDNVWSRGVELTPLQEEVQAKRSIRGMAADSGARVLEVRRDGEDAVLCLLQNSIGGHGLVSGNQRSDPHDRFTVLLPGHAHFRPDHMDSAFSVPNGLFASG